MSYQNISSAISGNDMTAIKAAIDDIGKTMPFLVTLSETERKTLFKLGPKSIDFVQDAALAASNYPDILPANFNKSEFAKDTELAKNLSEIKLLLDSLSEKINDTLMAVGSEAMSSALEVYSYVQTAAEKTPGLKSVAEKLKERFKRQGKPKTTLTT